MAALRIPLFDTSVQLQQLRPELDRRLLEVVESGHFVLGPEGERFESDFAGYLGVEHVIGVANGTDALTIALRALGVGPGDEVIVPSFTFFATAEAVVNIQAVPVFCDVDPDTFSITAESVERVLTPRSRAVIPVHLFGIPTPMDELRVLAGERDLKLLEDAAQAAGATIDGRRVGALGDAATFSFFPSKNLFCLGDGGAIATNDPEVASEARLLRTHGSPDRKQTFVKVGYNSRLDELQAAVLQLGLARLDEWNAGRRALAATYAELGLGELVSLPSVPVGAEPAYHMYVVRSDARERLIEALSAAGVSARQPYFRAVHEQEAMKKYAAELPATKLVTDTSLALPMGPTRTAEDARIVVEALRQALNSA